MAFRNSDLVAYGMIDGAGAAIANNAGCALTAHATGKWTITLDEPLPEAECDFYCANSWPTGSAQTIATAGEYAVVHSSDTVKVIVSMLDDDTIALSDAVSFKFKFGRFSKLS